MPLDSIRRKIEHFPDTLAVFDGCLECFARRGDIGVAISGSLFHGTIDRYSDLDFEVVAHPETSVEALQEWVSASIRRVAPLLGHFPATHLGLDHLLVSFFARNDHIVKVDVAVLDLEGFSHHPSASIVWDPGGKLARSRTAPSPARHETHVSPDFEDIHHKFCGWIWYTYSKIARGECLEAVDSLDTMRRYALLPCLHLIESLPSEGYRWAERRLSAKRLSSLQRTFPSDTGRRELSRALFFLVEFFVEVQPLVAERLARDHRSADLEGMVRIIERLGWNIDGEG